METPHLPRGHGGVGTTDDLGFVREGGDGDVQEVAPDGVSVAVAGCDGIQTGS